MAISITKMSQNGQVVIPSEVREDAKLKPTTQFLVFNEGDDILLKRISKEQLLRELELIRRIELSEEQFAKGEYVEVDTKMSVKNIRKKLTKSR